jgi:phosphatidate phosphatase APP1
MGSNIISAPATDVSSIERVWGSNPQPHLRLYHSFGDEDGVLVMGHALLHKPRKPERYLDGFWPNVRSMLRLFALRAIPHARVRIRLGNEVKEIQAADDGFFAADWAPTEPHPKTWEDVSAELIDYPGVRAEAKVYMPPAAPFGVISDVDDTFLVTNTDSLVLRLSTLLTHNARTRKPFTGVVEHYKALALAQTTPDKPNPFFYVSSSEWNLYDYLKEFCRFHGMPEGVFLLNHMKTLKHFWNTGGNNHDGKFTRVARILQEFPNQQFILMGDDTQRDPHIYAAIVRDFPGRILCVYIRHRVKAHLERTRKYEKDIRALGAEVCYFTHSSTALQHSISFGLVKA